MEKSLSPSLPALGVGSPFFRPIGSAAPLLTTTPRFPYRTPSSATCAACVHQHTADQTRSPSPLLPLRVRWLDLFAGTGAIGLEALSRGCGEAHFVELSPWVVSNCLLPNLESCELEDSAVVHTMVGAYLKVATWAFMH